MLDRVQLSLITLLLASVITLLVLYVQNIKYAHKTGSSSKLKKPTFLILGLNNSGKSSLYFHLLSQVSEDVVKPRSTVTSIEPNITDIKLPFSNKSISRKFQLVDYPGHLKYSQLLNKLILEDITLHNIRGIVYVIDSSASSITNSQSLKQIARFLFNLFLHTEKLINGIDFLFAVNKQDLFDSVPIFKIRQGLEEEITYLIKEELSQGTNKSGIDNDDENSGNSSDYESLREFWMSVVGNKDATFKFDMLEGNMDFLPGSVLKNKTTSWEDWFDEKVVN